MNLKFFGLVAVLCAFIESNSMHAAENQISIKFTNRPNNPATITITPLPLSGNENLSVKATYSSHLKRRACSFCKTKASSVFKTKYKNMSVLIDAFKQNELVFSNPVRPGKGAIITMSLDRISSNGTIANADITFMNPVSGLSTRASRKDGIVSVR